MGFRFRKSRKVGPFRVNFSKSGVGWSVGNKLFRYTKKAGGGTRTTYTIPGTGISHVTDSKSLPDKVKAEKEQKGAGTMKKKKIGSIAVAVIVGLMVMSCTSNMLKSDDPKPPVETSMTDVRDLTDKAEPEETPTEAPETEQPAEVEIPVVDDPVEEKPAETKPAETKPEPAPVPVTHAVIGNINSKVYHEPGCNSVQKMKDSNKVNFDSPEAAQNKGYKPCQNCH